MEPTMEPTPLPTGVAGGFTALKDSIQLNIAPEEKITFEHTVTLEDGGYDAVDFDFHRNHARPVLLPVGDLQLGWAR